MRYIRRAVTLCICMMVFCSCAFAENTVGFNGPGYDALSYACTLPDGRMIFTGYRGIVLICFSLSHTKRGFFLDTLWAPETEKRDSG